MYLAFLFGIFITNSDMARAYVYCQDSNALPWVPLGYSCPVNCASVAAAVERLKAQDFEDTLVGPLVLPKPNTTWVNTLHNNLNKDLNRTHYENLYKILIQTKAQREIRALLKRAAVLKQDCYLLDGVEVSLNGCKGIKKNGAFVKEFTKVLNVYTKGYTFSESVAEKLLKIIYGLEFNGQSGLFDISSILKYLRGVIARHKTKPSSGAIITLQSQYCLNVYVPGCFCKPGFVEQRGQCLKPQACNPHITDINQYLNRIIIR